MEDKTTQDQTPQTPEDKVVIESVFPLGRIAATPGVLATFSTHEEMVVALQTILSRHGMADWGEIDSEDATTNDLALVYNNGRLLSAYTLRNGTRVWVITEADRASTTILLPEEY